MVRKKVVFSLFLALLVVGLAGCQKGPTGRIADAQRALDTAVKEQADRYAPSEYKAAQETLSQAREENDKKNYERANQLAFEAERQARITLRAADKNRKEIKDYIKKAIEEARQVINQTKEEYENAKKLNVPEGDLAMANSALVSAETDLKQADDVLASGDIITAREKVKAVQNKLMNAQQHVRNLVALKAAPYKKD